MAKYMFEAKAANGKDTRGEIEAATEAEARIKLRAQRLIPIRLVSSASAVAPTKSISGRGISTKDMQILTRQLSTLMTSGIPILQSVEALASSTRNKNLGLALNAISADITKGRRFGDALAEHPKIFNRFYVNLVRAGEESGSLDQMFNRLATYIEKSGKIQSKIKGAMVYPVVILTVAFAVVAGLMVFVIPKFAQLFSSMGGELPALTQMVMKLSDIFMGYWYLIIAGIGGIVWGAMAYYATPNGRKNCDKFFIEIPLVGDLIEKSAVAKFSRTLSTLLSSGVGIMEGLEISSKTVGNYVIEIAVLRARDAISEGKSLTVPFQKEKHIPLMVTQMISIGEQTGNLDQMLSRVADFYEEEVDVAVTALTTVIEPMLMVFLGIIVAFIVIAMYLPIFNLANNVG